MTNQSKENSPNDVELDKIIGLFDAALTSKDPRVKEALSKLLCIVALVEPDIVPSDTALKGPLGALKNQIHDLYSKVNILENRMSVMGGYNYTSTVAPYTVTLTNPNLNTADAAVYSNVGPGWLPNVSANVSATTTDVSSQLDLFYNPTIKI